MSRPERPFRATFVMAERTIHYDYATKRERDFFCPVPEFCTTVTSRKPLKPGTPVCWVNVFNDPREFTIYGSKEAADEYALANQRRVACIPVYLPGEGAPPGPDVYYKQWRYMKAERDAAKASEANHRALADQGINQLREKWVACIQEKKLLQAEVEQWKDAAEHAEGKLSEERMSSQAERKECDKLQAEVDRLTGELAAAQAQTMPAGKVVYGASGKFGINRDFQTIEFADKRLRDTYRKSDGWTWFTRVEES